MPQDWTPLPPYFRNDLLNEHSVGVALDCKKQDAMEAWEVLVRELSVTRYISIYPL